MSLITKWFVLEDNFQRKIQNKQAFNPNLKVDISFKFIRSSLKTTKMIHRKGQLGKVRSNSLFWWIGFCVENRGSRMATEANRSGEIPSGLYTLNSKITVNTSFLSIRRVKFQISNVIQRPFELDNCILIILPTYLVNTGAIYKMKTRFIESYWAVTLTPDPKAWH